tara:strand:- start:5020 stop:5943 length:924 start_codon:yes stop_codon:yes gene_type:complete
MKHPKKVSFVILAMFLITQLIGIVIISIYSPQTSQVLDEQGNLINVTTHNLPFGTEPPSDISPQASLISIVIAISIAVFLILIFMKFNLSILLRIWFFFVVTLALGITLNAFLLKFPFSALIAIIIALPLAIIKIFKRNIYVHNLTELLIYPGIAAIFVPLLNIWAAVLLLIFISMWDAYAVWNIGFMQKMARFQIEKVRVFGGFFVPYINKKQKAILKQSKDKGIKNKKMKIPIAILGGGDVVFPLILAGVVLQSLGILPAIIIALGATVALTLLLYFSDKGKAYPAMPFITTGCLIALGVVLLLP